MIGSDGQILDDNHKFRQVTETGQTGWCSEGAVRMQDLGWFQYRPPARRARRRRSLDSIRFAWMKVGPGVSDQKASHF